MEPSDGVTPFPFVVPKHPAGEPLPVCDEAREGQVRTCRGVPSTDDGLYACARTAAGTFAGWSRIGTVTGATGPTGPAGSSGAAGSTGPTGPGANVTEVWYSAFWNPANIGADDDAGTTVSMSGVMNDGEWVCNASHTQLANTSFGNQQWFITAWPEDDNTVMARLLNKSGNPQDLPSGTLTIWCRKRPT